MKDIINMARRILLGVLLAVAITSCTQNDGYIGPIFGKWQLTEMWKGQTMTPHDSIYYNFQTSIIQLQLIHRQGISNISESFYGNYEKENGELRFSIVEPSSYPAVLPDVFNLKPMGIDNVNVFHIETLNSSKMVLTRGEDERFVFRKF